jgi:hypothetical protein
MRIDFRSSMAETAHPLPPADDRPPLDPLARQRAYHFYRSRRYAREEHVEERRRAGARFFLVLVLLIAVSIFLGVIIWHHIQNLFGL